ncbi:hypothetical protein OPT61_g3538 [Boeremia exigua]|uniref:Uncharacterized protein n=1 Tax=Boeremia exigua TaxID=749465 RepID=A0ACC2IHR4_9PLEO|nr:hypothetical protein OPT61_g3538 [Boeremia exigua]
MSNSTSEWFQRMDSNVTIFEPIQRLNGEKHGWTLAKLGLEKCNTTPNAFSISDSADVYNFSEEDAHKSITELTQRDQSATAQDKAQSQAYLAATAYRNWKIDRGTKSARKLGAGVQRFLCTVGDFLKSFSGIAEIVKSADQQFGGLAYGTVALVATVAVLKQQRENSIERALEELSHAFPRLNTLRRLSPGVDDQASLQKALDLRRVAHLVPKSRVRTSTVGLESSQSRAERNSLGRSISYRQHAPHQPDRLRDPNTSSQHDQHNINIDIGRPGQILNQSPSNSSSQIPGQN